MWLHMSDDFYTYLNYILWTLSHFSFLSNCQFIDKFIQLIKRLYHNLSDGPYIPFVASFIQINTPTFLQCYRHTIISKQFTIAPKKNQNVTLWLMQVKLGHVKQIIWFINTHGNTISIIDDFSLNPVIYLGLF